VRKLANQSLTFFTFPPTCVTNAARFTNRDARTLIRKTLIFQIKTN
jgi:hypothetical protein